MGQAEEREPAEVIIWKDGQPLIYRPEPIPLPARFDFEPPSGWSGIRYAQPWWDRVAWAPPLTPLPLVVITGI